MNNKICHRGTENTENMGRVTGMRMFCGRLMIVRKNILGVEVV